ncbi:MAG: hypothetical protein D6806_08300 [Deltaproteobacteria bacterium]|nr:MAG: hypothetical protein D6806_08300 [Deltaproteobacteria bacterium]
MSKGKQGTKVRSVLVLAAAFCLAVPLAAAAAGDAGADDAGCVRSSETWVKLWSMIKPSTLWYLGYGWGEKDGENFSRGYIGRGYLTLKFKPVEWFQPRVTLDAHQDETGDFNVRLKYLYGKFVLPVETAWITEPAVEFGLVHGPWFDYEEHINLYRAQGTMLIERNGVLNSADVGVTVTALLGRKLPEDYRKNVSKHYPGTWGSISFGVYNGGGYHAKEYNQNKVFESRISVRPLGPWLPNLQLSHFFIFGRGNTPPLVCDEQGSCVPGEPRWLHNSFMASFEHRYFVATAQVAFGKGNQKGDKVDAEGKPLESFGYSGFVEIKLPWIISSVIGRYDHWEWGDSASDRVIAGWAVHFYEHNYLLLNLDWVRHPDSEKPDDWQLGLVLQVHL